MKLLFFYHWIADETARALCWTFIHSLWQGLVVAIVAGIILVSTRRSPASLRYNLLTGLLFIFVLGAGITFLKEWQSIGTSSTTGSLLPEQQEVIHRQTTTLQVKDATDQGNAFHAFKTYFNQQAPLIVLIWGLFFLYHFIKLLAGLNYIHRIRYTKLEDPSEEWQQKLKELSTRLGITQTVYLFQSHLVKIPAVVGMLKPAILVPAGLLTNLPPSYVEAILLHELAHIRRKDFGVNLLQTLVETVFFFNPALIWLSSLIREEREACCDDMVVAYTGDKNNYLEALVSFQEESIKPAPYAMALKGRKEYLLNRVRRMLTQENKRLSVMEKTVLFTGLIVFSAFAFIPSAQVPAKRDTTPKKQTVVLHPTTPVPVRQVITAKALTPAVQVITTQEPILVIDSKDPETTVEFRVDTLELIKDTVPKKNKAAVDKYNFRNVTTNYNNTDGEKSGETIAVTGDGKVYRYKVANGKITEVTVDGTAVPKEQWGEFQEMWDTLERRKEESEAKRAEMEERRAELREQRLAHQETRRIQQAKQNAGDRERKNAEMHRKNSDMQRRQMEMQQRQRELTESRRAIQEERAMYATSVGKGNNEIDVIVQELIEEKVITSKDAVSFTLTSDELVVNGKKQDSNLQQRLKERLRIDKGDSFQYKNEKGSTTTTVVRN